MSLETVSGAMLLFVPLVIFAIALIVYSVRYWLEKRKEDNEAVYLVSPEEYAIMKEDEEE